jgi:hypothetical protein
VEVDFQSLTFGTRGGESLASRTSRFTRYLWGKSCRKRLTAVLWHLCACCSLNAWLSERNDADKAGGHVGTRASLSKTVGLCSYSIRYFFCLNASSYMHFIHCTLFHVPDYR